MKSQQNANISGFGNVIIQNQYEIQKKQQLSEKYSPSDYCSKSKTLGKFFRFLISCIGFLSDFIAIKQLIFPTMTNMFKYIPNNLPYLIQFLFYSVVIIIVALFSADQIHTLYNIHQKGISSNLYQSDKLYRLKPHHCPICNAKIKIINNSGCITFKCCHSNHHSKQIDITELDDLSEI